MNAMADRIWSTDDRDFLPADKRYGPSILGGIEGETSHQRLVLRTAPNFLRCSSSVRLGIVLHLHTVPAFPKTRNMGTVTETSNFDSVQWNMTPMPTTEKLCRSFLNHTIPRVRPRLSFGHAGNNENLQGQMKTISACLLPEDLLVLSNFEQRGCSRRK